MNSKYDDVYIFVPKTNEILCIAEGTGDNLLYEDLEKGYVDYIYYEQYELDNGVTEADGGMVLLKHNLRNEYSNMAECIPDVLKMAYGEASFDYVILAREG